MEKRPSSSLHISHTPDGRKIINSAFSGGVFTEKDLSKNATDADILYFKTIAPEGIRFSQEGRPDYTPFAIRQVELDTLTGKPTHDNKLANRQAGISPEEWKTIQKDYVWHHVEDGKTMQLIPRRLHKLMPHCGGCYSIRHQAPLQSASASISNESYMHQYSRLPEDHPLRSIGKFNQQATPSTQGTAIAYDTNAPHGTWSGTSARVWGKTNRGLSAMTMLEATVERDSLMFAGGAAELALSTNTGQRALAKATAKAIEHLPALPTKAFNVLSRTQLTRYLPIVAAVQSDQDARMHEDQFRAEGKTDLADTMNQLGQARTRFSTLGAPGMLVGDAVYEVGRTYMIYAHGHEYAQLPSSQTGELVDLAIFGVTQAFHTLTNAITKPEDTPILTQHHRPQTTTTTANHMPPMG